jgi:hypothetical protein
VGPRRRGGDPMSERVVEFGDTRYEWVDGLWWPDVTPQERALVEELERQQEGIRTGAAERDRLRADLDLALYLLRRVASYTSLPTGVLHDIENLLEVDQ